MHVQFFRIDAESLQAKADYIAIKLAHSPSCLPQVEHWAQSIDALDLTPQLAEVANWPRLSAAQRKEVQRRIACGASMADRFLPLVEGEVIEEDLFSYLTDDWEHAPKGTPVLRRTTSQALIYCFFEEMEVTPGKAKPLRPVPTEDADWADRALDHEETPEVDAEETALKIASALCEERAAFAVEQVMGGAVPDYFGQAYGEIRGIVAEEMNAHLVREITDEFSGAQLWNNNHYLPLAQAVPPPPKQVLADEMNFTVRAFYGYLAKLMDAQVAQICLGEFMIGASMHLSFIQEVCKVTGAPNWKQELSLDAAQWATHAELTWEAVRDARAAKIEVQADGECVPVDGATKCAYYYTTYDCLAQTWGGKFYYRASDDDSGRAAKARAEAEAASRRLAAVENLRATLGKPEETIAKWRGLI